MQFFRLVLYAMLLMPGFLRVSLQWLAVLETKPVRMQRLGDSTAVAGRSWRLGMHGGNPLRPVRGMA